MASQIHPDIRGWHENLPVRLLHEVYPAIDPASAWASQSFKGKAVFITGASRGIGRATAITFAKAGAAVAIAARSDRALDETKALILSEVPDARVESYVVDVTKGAEMEVAVDGAVAAFGSLDVVIENAGYCNSFDTPMDQRSANEWWRTFEVNVLSVYNTVRPAVKHLREASGYCIAVSSIGAQSRWPGGSDYLVRSQIMKSD